jgi:transcription factor CRZ1
MDQQRGRSPSAGHQQPHINQSHSPSPQQFQENANSIGLGLGLDNQGNNNQQFLNNNFNSNHGLPAYVDNNEFLNQQGQAFSQSSLSEPTYIQSQDFNQQFKQEEQSSPFNPQQQGSFTQELLDPNLSPNFNQGDFPLFSTPGNQSEQYDPSFFMNELPAQPSNQALNPSQLDMSSPQNHTPTPPNLLQPDSRSPSSAHNSPNFNQGQFQSSPNHSRNASLGPESAAFPQAQNQVEWSMMPPQFTGHRRTPSEYSDVSVSSAAHSPNLGHHDTFEPIEHHHSPMQHPQDSSLYNEVLGIGSFTLSDPQIQHAASPRRGLTPAHSPAISPRLGPQQLPNMQQQNNFMLSVNNGFGPPQNIYGSSNQDSFTQMEMGQAQQMVPPEINVEFAPSSRQNSFEPPKPSFDQDALTPPDRGMPILVILILHVVLTDISRSPSPSCVGSI